MATRSSAHQISLRCRPTDGTTGVTRDTAKRLRERLGVHETQAIRLALHAMAVKLLPRYEADDGPLTADIAFPQPTRLRASAATRSST